MERPLCPTHGVVSVPPADEGAAAELPRFPGYRTLRIIGRGGFGTVVAVEPDGGGPLRAVKLAHAWPDDAGRRLVHEITVLSAVGPPHVPALHGSGRLPGGSPYVIMEYVDAPTLADLLIEGPLPPGDAIALAVAVLRALHAVHARGFAHLDLKPENVFAVAGAARIVDFGLVAGLVAGQRATPDTRVEVAAGTAEYMAPEQCDHREAVDARADLYAMGVILHELVAGAPPFWGPPAMVRESHLSRRPPRLSALVADVPRGLEDIVLRCLAKDPRDRFESAAALGVALAEEAARATAPRVASLAAARRHRRARRRATEPARPAASARDERRTVGLLFFESHADVLAVQQRLATLGGQLAHASGGRCVAIYALGDNPARSARRAAHELLRAGLCERVRLDVAAVSVQLRADGSKRYLSPIFGRPERFPGATDPPGVSQTPAAVEVLADAEPYAVEGRDELVAALVESARRAVQERSPTVVRVIAAAGHGKSQLLRVLAARLAEIDPPAEEMAIRAPDPALGGADGTVRELLQRTLDLPAAAPASGGEALLRGALGRYGVADAAPAVAVALGWVAMDGPPSTLDGALASGLRTLEAAPGALRSALTTATAAALRGRAAARPVLVLVDDAHQADDPALAALENAALAEEAAPLWICAFGRPLFDEEHPSWGESASRREAHTLGPLDAPSAARLCRRLLLPAEDVPDSAVERLVERTQGIPLLLVELTRGLRREGLLRPRPEGDSYYLATDELDRLPDLPLVEWQAQGEIDALPEAQRAHARLAALLGDEVSLADTEGVLRRLDRLEDDDAADAPPLDARIGIRQLVSAGLLVEDRNGRVAFRHGLVREAIAKGVPEARRARIHRAAVDHYLGATPTADRDRQLAQLAFHAAEAGIAAVAHDAYLDLAERMGARHAYLPAERGYSRALEQPGEGDVGWRLAAYRGRGLMRYRLGRYHDALADFAAARALARSAGDVAAEIEILLDEATALDWMNDFAGSDERVQEAQALLSQVRSPVLEARMLLGVGRSTHRASREEEAAALIEDASTRAAALGDEGYETRVVALVLLGFIYSGLGRLDDAGRVLDGAIALSEAHGDDLHLAGAIYNRAVLWLLRGDLGQMVADFERGLALARKLGQVSLELVGEANLTEFLYLLDQTDAAEPHLSRALALERRHAAAGVRRALTLMKARFQLYRGAEAEAKELLAALRAEQERAAEPGPTDGRMVPSEEVLADMIDLATRDASAAEWDALEERSLRCSVGQEQIEVLEARALAALRRGRAGEAVLRMENAVALAARIPNAMGARLRRGLAQACAAHAAARGDAARAPPSVSAAYTANEMPKPTNQA